MKIAVSADLHFSAYSNDPIVDDLPERLNSLYNTLNNMMEECKKRNIWTVAFAGDLLHNKSIIHATAQDKMLEFFRAWSDHKFFVIDGNHDLSSKGSDAVSSLKSLETYENVRWISYQSKREAVHQINDGKVAFLPYFPGMDKHIKNIKSDILISHFGLNEGVLSSGISIPSTIRATHLKHFKLVVLGHYHLPQEMKTGKTHIYYTGSPIQLDWGEKNEEKRFLIIDTDNPHNVESIKTNGYKQYIELELDSDNKTEVLEHAKKMRDDGHHVKLVTSEKLDLKDEEMSSINVVSNVEEDITNRGITSGMDELAQMKKYLEIKEIPEEEHEAYLATAKNLIDKTVIPD